MKIEDKFTKLREYSTIIITLVNLHKRSKVWISSCAFVEIWLRISYSCPMGACLFSKFLRSPESALVVSIPGWKQRRKFKESDIQTKVFLPSINVRETKIVAQEMFSIPSSPTTITPQITNLFQRLNLLLATSEPIQGILWFTSWNQEPNA